ncbi:MAG TPA: urease accessory protein UreE [Burkholderiales bacterium]|nr:urease accessory protein UreE [Burkholderiales bacterium]
MLTLTQRLPADTNAAVPHRLALSAEERVRSRHRFMTEQGEAVQLALPRGTALHDGDLLADAEGRARARVHTKPEPVLTARATDAFTLLRAAYHLGNRHVALELGRDYLRISPDTVLAEMLIQLGLTIISETVPFQPEPGAYSGHSHEFVRMPRPHHG